MCWFAFCTRFLGLNSAECHATQHCSCNHTLHPEHTVMLVFLAPFVNAQCAQCPCMYSCLGAAAVDPLCLLGFFTVGSYLCGGTGTSLYSLWSLLVLFRRTAAGGITWGNSTLREKNVKIKIKKILIKPAAVFRIVACIACHCLCQLTHILRKARLLVLAVSVEPPPIVG